MRTIKFINLHSFLLLFLFALPAIVHAQLIDSTKTNTLLGNQNIKTGIIIKREFTDLSEYKRKGLFTIGTDEINFDFLKLTDLKSGNIYKGLYISTSINSTVATKYVSFIDADEISGLIDYLKFILDKTKELPKVTTEYLYNFKDLRFSSFTSNERKNIIWNFAIKVNLYSSSTFYFQQKDIEDLLKKLQESKEQFQ